MLCCSGERYRAIMALLLREWELFSFSVVHVTNVVCRLVPSLLDSKFLTQIISLLESILYEVLLQCVRHIFKRAKHRMTFFFRDYVIICRDLNS